MLRDFLFMHGGALSGLLDFAFGRIKARRRQAEFDAFSAAGLAFIHIPRCAGTSISHEIYGTFINHYTLAEHERMFCPELREVPILSVVRNPWDRLVSCWAMAKAGRGFEGDVTVNRRDRRPVEQFESFERFVLDRLIHLNRRQAGILFAPQVNFVISAQGELRIDHLGRFENLAPTEEWLSRKLGRAISFPRRNSAPRADYRTFYTNEMIDAVRTFYRADVELFRYDFE